METIIVLTIIVTMGIMSGGLIALTLLAPPRTQNIFALMAAIGLLLGAAGVAVAALQSLPVERGELLLATLENTFNLVLAGGLGYAVTTFFVLNRRPAVGLDLPDRAAAQAAAGDGPAKIAVLYFVPGEPEQYDPVVLAAGLDTQDYRQSARPTLLRPFTLYRLKHQYRALGHSPLRTTHLHLAQKVQDRLGRRARVYICFYNDQPGLAEAAATAIREGARMLVVLHARLTDPPPQLRVRDLLAPVRPERYGVAVVETAAQWDSDLLPRLFVRRAQAAVPAEARDKVGLLLVGAGHPALGQAVPGTPGADDVLRRQHQELTFQKRVRQALIRGGFHEDKVVIGWYAWQEPPVAGAQAQVLTEQPEALYWLATGFPAPCLATEVIIPARLRAAAPAPPAPAATPLGPWGDDDLVAESLADQVKAVLPA